MATLDTLYGAGTLASLTAGIARALPSATISQQPNPDGTVHVEVTFGSKLLKCDFRGKRIDISYLSTMCAANTAARETDFATSKALNLHIAPWLKGIGVTEIHVSPRDEASRTSIAATGGYSTDEHGDLTWVL